MTNLDRAALLDSSLAGILCYSIPRCFGTIEIVIFDSFLRSKLHFVCLHEIGGYFE